MNIDNKYFLLFTSCIPVKGHSVTLIYDTERGGTIEVDNLIYDVLQSNAGKTIGQLKAYYKHEYDEGIEAYFHEFVQLEYGFFTDIPEQFPPIDLSWDSPFHIENAIIEIVSFEAYDAKKGVKEIAHLGCQFLQLRFLNTISSLHKLQELLSYTNDSRVRGIEIFLKFDDKISNTLILESLFKEFPRIGRICVHSSPEEKTHPDNSAIFFTKKVITANSREVISPRNFTVSLPIFTEAQSFNIGLNRKVSIDSRGFIKNYPSHHANFGHINSDSIAKVISMPDFRKKWFINNDLIEVCKDCQFRYMCTSNSDLIQQENKLYKKDKCNFDPYSNYWHQS